MMTLLLLSALALAIPPEALEAFRIELRQYRIYDLERSTPLLEKACQAKYEPACAWKRKMKRKDMTERFETATAFFDSYCGESDPWACVIEGWTLSQTSDVPSVLSPHAKAPSQAYRLFEQACKWGNSQGCTEMAKMRFRGVGIIQDTASSVEVLSQSCIANNTEACIILGTFRTTGIGMQVDMRAAKQLISQACEKGDPTGCAMQGALLISLGDEQTGLAILKEAKNAGSSEAYYRLGEHYFFEETHGPSEGKTLLEDACRDGRPDACHLLGVQYSSGEYLPQNDTVALRYLSQACKGSTPESCHAAALSYHEGVGTSKNSTEARRLFNEGCTQGFGESCFFLALYEEEGIGGNIAIPAARQHYEQACEAQDARACVNGALMLLAGEGGIAIPERAFAFFERACALGEIGGCASLGALYEDGIGTEPNLEKSSLLYAMACDGGDSQACEARMDLDQKAFLGNQDACNNGVSKACYHMAMAYEKGQGVEQSPNLAAQAAQKGCDGNDMPSCTKVGFYYIEGLGVRPDFTQAHSYFQKACSNNYGPGCYSLGLLFFEGRGVSKSVGEATKQFTQACALEDGRGCHHAARLLLQQTPPKINTAIPLLSSGCQLEIADSCVQLGALHLDEPADYTQAFQSFLSGCELGSGSGCFNGAVVLNQGHLPNVDPSLIGRLLQQGCDLGYRQACEVLR